tara:strand:- start:2640 stop:2888 length:249 start_codon:yes stop_codon:yes gene_type:complete
VIAFAAKDDDGQEVAAIAKLCDYASNTLISRFTPERTEIDSVYDLRAVFQTGPATCSSTRSRRCYAAETEENSTHETARPLK